MTIGDWLRHAAETLTESGSPDPQVDSKWIAEDILRMTPSELHFQLDRALDTGTYAQLETLLKRRANGEPLQYILGGAYFMGLRFSVDKRVLIPRQDTETLAESAIIALRGMKKPRVLDLCTGSGAIGISIKTLIPSAEVTLADVSRDALDVAHKNAHDLNADVDIRHGDLFKAVGRDQFDLIASNPPYIPRGDIDALQKEVQYEPLLALDGGEDGLDVYRRIAKEAPAHLKPEGYVYLEVGIGQADAVLQLIRENIDCAESGVINDLNGVPRVVWARSV